MIEEFHGIVMLKMDGLHPTLFCQVLLFHLMVYSSFLTDYYVDFKDWGIHCTIIFHLTKNKKERVFLFHRFGYRFLYLLVFFCFKCLFKYVVNIFSTQGTEYLNCHHPDIPVLIFQQDYQRFCGV